MRRWIGQSQRSFELVLEPVRPLQQRLQLTDELAADDVLLGKVSQYDRLSQLLGNFIAAESQHSLLARKSKTKVAYLYGFLGDGVAGSQFHGRVLGFVVSQPAAEVQRLLPASQRLLEQLHT